MTMDIIYPFVVCDILTPGLILASKLLDISKEFII
jgi:hypothetical protein